MPNLEEKHKTLACMKETTNSNSYQPPEMRPLVKTTYRAKRRKPRPHYVPIRYLHALTPYKNPKVLFDLFHRPDPMIRRDPWKMQEPYGSSNNHRRYLFDYDVNSAKGGGRKQAGVCQRQGTASKRLLEMQTAGRCVEEDNAMITAMNKHKTRN